MTNYRSPGRKLAPMAKSPPKSLYSEKQMVPKVRSKLGSPNIRILSKAGSPVTNKRVNPKLKSPTRPAPGSKQMVSLEVP